MIPNFDVASGSFTRPTDGSSTVVTGLSFTPKLLLVWGCNSATGDSADVRFSIGAFDGANQFHMQYTMDTTDATYWTYCSADSANIYQQIGRNGGGTTAEGRSIAQALTSDGFILSWPTYNASAPLIFWQAFGGEAVRGAKVGLFNSPTATGFQDVNVGFPVDTLFLIGVNAASGGATQELNFTMGFASANANAGSGTGSWGQGSADDASTPTNTAKRLRTAGIYTLMNTNTSLQKRLATFNRATVNGFRLSHSVVEATIAQIGYIALAGITGKTTSFSQPTSTGDQSLTGMPFQPEAFYNMTWNRAAALGIQAGFNLGLGFADGTNEQNVVIGATDNVNPIVAREAVSTTKVIRNVTEGASGVTVNSEADFKSFNSDGLTVTWTTVDATARVTIYFVLAPIPVYKSALLGSRVGEFNLVKKLWDFNNDTDGWVVSVGSWGATVGKNSTGGIGNTCTSSGGGCFAVVDMSWSGTFEDMGAPVGSTVEKVWGGFYDGTPTGVEAWGQGSTKRIITLDLQDEFGSSLYYMIDTRDLAGNWRVERPDYDEVNAPTLNLPSNTPVILYLSGQGRMLPGSIGIAKMYVDNVYLTLKYRH